MPLHKLVIKNHSKVVSLALHNSGKILLALYDNGVLRLWDMTGARCIFKRKLGIVAPEEEATPQEDEDDDLGDEEAGEVELEEMQKIELKKKDLSDF